MDHETTQWVALGASVLYAIGCEVLNFSPNLKSNSMLELVMNVLSVISGRKK